VNPHAEAICQILLTRTGTSLHSVRRAATTRVTILVLAKTKRTDLVSGRGKNTVNRKCKIPAGQSVFFPVITNECSIREGHGKNDSELRRCNKRNIDEVKHKSVTINGANVNLGKHRVQSPTFRLNLSKNNILGQHVGSKVRVRWVLDSLRATRKRK
jgi:hypothetical protein